MSEDRIDNEPFREAFRRSGMTPGPAQREVYDGSDGSGPNSKHWDSMG